MNYRELLAEARAIHFAMHHGSISYEEAQVRVKPVLEIINRKVIKLAKKYGVKPRLIKYQDLGKTF